MASCPACGAELLERAAFCTRCGAVLDRPSTTETSTQPVPAAEEHVVATQPAVTHHYGDVGIYIARRFSALVVDIVVVGLLLATLVAHSLPHASEGLTGG